MDRNCGASVLLSRCTPARGAVRAAADNTTSGMHTRVYPAIPEAADNEAAAVAAVAVVLAAGIDTDIAVANVADKRQVAARNPIDSVAGNAEGVATARNRGADNPADCTAAMVHTPAARALAVEHWECDPQWPAKQRENYII